MFACDLKNLFEWKQKQNVELNTEITVKQIAHKFLSKSVGLNEWNYDFYARTTQNAEIECEYIYMFELSGRSDRCTTIKDPYSTMIPIEGANSLLDNCQRRSNIVDCLMQLSSSRCAID